MRFWFPSPTTLIWLGGIVCRPEESHRKTSQQLSIEASSTQTLMEALTDILNTLQIELLSNKNTNVSFILIIAPPAPSGISVTRLNDTTIRVSWRPLSLVEAQGHIMYRVIVTPTTGSRRRRQATQGERVCTLSSSCEVPANESSVIVGGLDRDTSYSVTVMAVNSEGEDGPTSVPISAPRTTSTPTVLGTFRVLST